MFDFLNFSETVVAEGLDGKNIMIYGGNNLGKTLQATRFPSPLFLPLEPGLNAIGGVRTLPVTDWESFKSFTNSMKDEKYRYERLLARGGDVEKNRFYQFKQQVKTIVIDSVTALGKSCEEYVTDGANVNELSDKGHGVLYRRFENEFYRTVMTFMKLGFTNVWIAHEEAIVIDEDKGLTKKVPKGDWKRVVKPIIDLCDIVAYLKSNGVDENNKVIPSTAYLAETEEFFARTKWENYMVTKLDTFSAENLQKALEDAIQKQKEAGIKVGTYEDQINVTKRKEIDFEEAREQIGEIAHKIFELDGGEEDGDNVRKYFAIVQEYLGVDGTVSEATERQAAQVRLILQDVKKLAEELGIAV